MNKTAFQTEIGWCSISWEGSEITAFGLLDESRESSATPDFVDTIIMRVKSHLLGELQDFRDVAFAWDRVTDFQRSVYQAALKVPAGKPVTYGELARMLHRSAGSARAVGTALGRNPWPLLVPCHRFVGANGQMTGFSAPGGIATKQRLLTIESAIPPSLLAA